MTRPSWDEYGLGLARSASARGDCTRRQVGAVVMDRSHRIVGAGYNGYPSGEPGCLSAGACPRGRLTYEQAPPGTGYAATGCKAIHAEVNAVEHALRGGSASKLTVYITDEPCDLCREYLTDPNHEVVRVVWPGGMLVRADLSKEFTE